MIFLEFDLAGAEWVVVAYLAEDANMIDIVESGKSPHVETGKLISGAPEELVLREHKLLGSTTDPDTLMQVRSAEIPELMSGNYFVPRTMTIRQAGKKSNHGLNYDMRYRTFALHNEMPETEAMPIVSLYHDKAYPGIRSTFHANVKKELRENDRTLVNLLGRKVRLLDQPGPDLWDKAYSFKPQSTVADIMLEGMITLYEDTSTVLAKAEPLANVYDSILVQFPEKPWDMVLEAAQRIKSFLRPTLRYKDYEFTLGVDCKWGHSWGEMEPLEVPE